MSTNTPNIINLSPSQLFQGNDGNWSSFPIQVGTPPVQLLVLPATSGRSIWAVNSIACANGAGGSNCASSRGEEFNTSTSMTWQGITYGNFTSFDLNFAPQAALNPLLPPPLAYTGSGSVGTDRVAFGFDGANAPVLIDQFVATYASNNPYLGELGLYPGNEDIGGYAKRYPGPLSVWNTSGDVSHAYYGYTAGASYREGLRHFGSLTFGGYDGSRGNIDSAITVPFSQPTERNLLVGVRLMTLSNSSGNQQLDLAPIAALIDSVVPEIWLPQAECAVIENAFGLTWNDTVQMYLVNDDQHARLMNSNASITLQLGPNTTFTSATAITLPYVALQSRVGYPLLYNLSIDTGFTLRYFHLKRAQTSDQVYLGRTFLQEAYLAVDYDKSEFYVSPAVFPSAQTPADLRPPNDSVNSPTTQGLSAGDKAGIAVGVLGGVALVIGLIWWFFFLKRTGRRDRKSAGTSSIGGNTIVNWNDGVSVGQVEFFKPMEEVPHEEESDLVKPELDATTTARGGTQRRSELSGDSGYRPSEQYRHRHELSSTGTVRRDSDQSRSSVSPLETRTSRRGHRRSYSYGIPSPPDHPSPPLGQFGSSSPPLFMSRDGQLLCPDVVPSPDTMGTPTPFFELHGVSRDSPASPSPAAEERVEPTLDQAASRLSREGPST